MNTPVIDMHSHDHHQARNAVRPHPHHPADRLASRLAGAGHQRGHILDALLRAALVHGSLPEVRQDNGRRAGDVVQRLDNRRPVDRAVDGPPRRIRRMSG